ncbi:MAG: shikimate kinase [Luminiphilus sp.]|nr:shikimate kinase [Luminiphilus sp.]MDG2443265.1 shikimate kinase [Luminiphilus sp.]
MPIDGPLKLAQFHPVFIEGMGSYDERTPDVVAQHIAGQLTKHWAKKPPGKPLIIVIQGDPVAARGISAITALVANNLGIARCLVCLDDHIADYHSANADRENVVLELRYTEMVRQLAKTQTDLLNHVEAAIDEQLAYKNRQREALGKPSLADYFRPFALLQEVTKAACAGLCGEITVIHTSAEISEFSVTSFFTVGLALKLVSAVDMVSFGSIDGSDSVGVL